MWKISQPHCEKAMDKVKDIKTLCFQISIFHSQVSLNFRYLDREYDPTLRFIGCLEPPPMRFGNCLSNGKA